MGKKMSREEKNSILKNRKIYLCGDLRCCRDFEYIFDDTYIVDKVLIKEVARLKELVEEEFVVICSFNQESVSLQLKELGLQYGRHYAYANDFFELLDFDIAEATSGKHIFLWGAGANAVNVLEKFEGVRAIIDSDRAKTGGRIDNIEIVHPDDIDDEEWKNLFIVVSCEGYYYEIKKILQEKGLKEKKNFVKWGNVNAASKMLEKTFYDTNYFDLCCESCFRVYEVETNGDVSACCTTLIRGRIGNLLDDSFWDVWESNLHKIQCLSLNNRSFSFCIPTSCPALINRKTCDVTDELAEKLVYKKFIGRPEYLHLSIDKTCNLYCESCREKIEIANGQCLEKANILKKKILSAGIQDIKSVLLAGNGEVFLSKTYEEIWRHEIVNNANVIRVQTNGMLLTPKRWEEFYVGKENADIWVYVSIDAATAETYEQVRRGGNFEVLKKNMEFAASLRKSGKIKYFRINFVVQRKNYLEMERFIEWGLELGVDNVFFTKILNWGTYTEQEFDEITMMDKNDVPKPEFAEILERDIFKNKIVDLGTIQYKKNRKIPTYVDNYYEWETRDWMENNRE